MHKTEASYTPRESPPPPEIVGESEYADDQLLKLSLESFQADLAVHADEFRLTLQQKENIFQLLERFPLSFRAALIHLIKQWDPADRHARYPNSTSFESGEYVLTSCGDPICRIENLHYSLPRFTLYGKRRTTEDARQLVEIHRHTIYGLLLNNLLTSRLYTVYFATS